MTPTQRTLKLMREQGRICWILEKWNPYAGIRQDVGGFLDLLCIDPVDGIVGVQSCGQSFSAHVKKMTEERNENMYEWLKHAKVELVGWRRVKLKRGGKAERWMPRIADFYIENGNVVCVERK